MSRPRARLAPLGLALAGVVAACAPRLAPLTGAPVPASRMPRTAITPAHVKIVFNWEFQERTVSGRGDGAARVSAPDSARVDFFLSGNLAGFAILINDSITAPGGDEVRRLFPPAPLMWAALGRVAVPNLPDTVVRMEGSTLRADIGRPVAWRLTFRGDTLVRAERVDDGRVPEWVERTDASHVRYRNERAHRTLRLSIIRREEVSSFDPSIWRLAP